MDNFPELDNETHEKKTRVIIDVDPKWPFWARLLSNLVNASGVFFWLFLTFFLLATYDSDTELAMLRNAMMNIVVPAVAYGIVSLIAGLSLVSWFFPYFSFRDLMQNGTPIERAACCGFWGMVVLAIAIIISAGIK